MDKLTQISATLFIAADVFAIVSLAMPDWIITESGTGKSTGITQKCSKHGPLTFTKLFTILQVISAWA